MDLPLLLPGVLTPAYCMDSEYWNVPNNRVHATCFSPYITEDFADQGCSEWLKPPKYHQDSLHATSLPQLLLWGARTVEGLHG